MICPILTTIEPKDGQETIILEGSDYFIMVYVGKSSMSGHVFISLEDHTIGEWTVTVEEWR